MLIVFVPTGVFGAAPERDPFTNWFGLTSPLRYLFDKYTSNNCQLIEVFVRESVIALIGDQLAGRHQDQDLFYSKHRYP
jgi:DNA-directed RNA polymerase beta subunit